MAQKPLGIMRKPKELIDGAIQAIKGPDVESLVEDFTSEMTVVAEGLCDDQMRLRRETEEMSARLTILEQQGPDVRRELADKLEGLQKTADTRYAELQKRLSALEIKQQKMGKKNQTLSQLTVLAGILAGAWVIVTVLGLLK